MIRSATYEPVATLEVPIHVRDRLHLVKEAEGHANYGETILWLIAQPARAVAKLQRRVGRAVARRAALEPCGAPDPTGRWHCRIRGVGHAGRHASWGRGAYHRWNGKRTGTEQ